MKRMLMAMVMVMVAALAADAGPKKPKEKVVRVWANDMQGWLFVNEKGLPCGPLDKCEFFTDPLAVSTIGDSAAHLDVSQPGDPDDRRIMVLPSAHDVKLRYLKALEYSTYLYETDDAGRSVPRMILYVDFDRKDGNKAADAKLVFDPALNLAPGQMIETGTWQSWDAFQDGQALWYIAEAPAGTVIACTAQNPCTFDEITSKFRYAALTKYSGGVAIEVGGHDNEHVDSLIDEVTIGTKHSYLTTYDFEAGGPVTYSQCKYSGWVGFFTSEGACIAQLK